MLKWLKFRTPIRLQINPIECGAVALGIILDHYGYPNTQSELNNLVGISRNGSDAAALIKGAKHFDVQASAKMVSVSEIKTSPKPSIAFFDSCHFVVVEGYHFGKYYINDPARGRYSLSEKEFRHRFSGIEISLKGQSRFPKWVSKSFGLWPFGIIGIFGGIVLSLFVLSLVETLSLWHGPKPGMSLVSCLGLGLILAIYMALTRSLLIATMDRNESDFQQQFIAKSTKLSPAFFETRPFFRYRSILDSVNTLLPYRSLIFSALFFICVVQALVFWPFSLILISLLLCIGLLSLLPTSLPKKEESLSNTLQQFPQMDAMGQGREVISRQLSLDHEIVSEHYRKIKGRQTNLMFLVSLSLIALALLSSIAPPYLKLGLLGHGDLLGSLSFVVLVSYLAHLGFKKPPNNDEYRKALVHEIDAQISEEPGTAILENAQNIIEIKHGSFVYPGESRYIFSDLNIELKVSTLYGLVGAAGCGKSTLLRLMGQKLALKSGECVMASHKGERIAFTLIDDDADLFSGSLLENVRVFDTRYSEHHVSDALNLAAIEELFYRRPLGLLTPIDQGGANISGGQKKRLLLARALLHKAPLVLLDNFFDSLDRQCAELILANLSKIETTLVFSSFRDWELAKSDQVIFVHDSIASIAPHDYWMQHSLAYQSLISHDDSGKKIL